ncbi:hypothetical protein V8F44DRAFT_662564 [Aspergillus fumigatus]
MARSNYLRIFRVLEEINQRHTIPDIYHEALEDRLVITFTQPLGPLKQSKTHHPKKEYKLQYKNTNAHRVYMEILEDYPQLFIPFILATPPKSCKTFKLGEFQEKHNLSTVKVDLRPNIQQTLDNIANQKGFNQNQQYQHLICTLFPLGQKPATTAKTQNCWAYRAAYLNTMHTIFSKQICSAMESGRGLEPSTQIVELGCYDSQLEQSTISQSKGYILQGVSISAILSVFSPCIWDNLSKETTDCVLIEIHPRWPHCSTCHSHFWRKTVHLSLSLSAPNPLALLILEFNIFAVKTVEPSFVVFWKYIIHWMFIAVIKEAQRNSKGFPKGALQCCEYIYKD